MVACDHASLPVVPAEVVAVQLDGCAADIGLSFVAQLLACGTEEIRVVPCPDRPAAVAERVASSGRAFDHVGDLEDVDTRRWRRSGPVFRLGSPTVARRAVLGLGLREEPALDLSGDDTARALAALAVLADQGRFRPDGVDLVPTDDVAVAIEAEGCTMCGVCVQACPNGAFGLTNDDGVGVLHHNAEACRSDRACVRLCPEGALSTTAKLTLVDLLDRPAGVLARLATAACGRCGALHPASEGALCATCRFRRSNPFGSQPMTGSDPAG